MTNLKELQNSLKGKENLKSQKILCYFGHWTQLQNEEQIELKYLQEQNIFMINVFRS